MFYVIFLFAILKLLIEKNNTVSNVCYLVFFGLLFLSIKKNFLNKGFLKRANYIFLIFLSIVFIGYIFIYLSFFSNDKTLDFYKPNNSIFSILLTSQIAFITPLFIWYYNLEKRNFYAVGLFCLTLTAALLLLVYSHGGAGWLGLLLALVHISYSSIKTTRVRNYF